MCEEGWAKNTWEGLAKKLRSMGRDQQNFPLRLTQPKSQISDALIYLCVTQSISGDVMLNPNEKFKVAILHLNRAWNH